MASNVEIIVKRAKKGDHGGHHGGAWKVAYADFVTAMMAFFLLLWLLNATTEEQKRGISDYFSPASVSHSQSGAGGMLGGRAISTPGAQISGTATPSLNIPLTPSEGASEHDGADDAAAASARDAPETRKPVDEDEAAKLLAKKEEERFAAAEQELRQAIQKSPELKAMQKNILIDRTPQGLRIQLVDQEGKPMFPLGSADVPARTQGLLDEISKIVGKLPNRISITGHTDATPFRGARKGYGNWELSSDRALASRRVLVEGGLDPSRVAMVVGRAAEDPLLPEDPNSPRNRRISIVLLRQAGPNADKEAATDAAAPGPAASPAPAVAPAPAARPSNPTGFQRDWTGPRLK